MQSLKEYLLSNTEDAITWQVTRWFDAAGDNPHERGQAADKMTELLSMIQNDVVRNDYVNSLTKKYKLQRSTINSQVTDTRKTVINQQQEAEEVIRWPHWMKKEHKEQVEIEGFTEREDGHHTGYYFMSDAESKTFKKLTNYLLIPLYHVFSQNTSDNRRLLELRNGFETRIIELNSQRALSPEYFNGTIFSQGNFISDGNFTKYHVMKLWAKLAKRMKYCYELLQLGWQAKEGFFAFSNVVYKPGKSVEEKGTIYKYNEYGVVEIDGQHYLSPGISKMNELVRDSENKYENDKYLTYKESPIDFNKWAEMMSAAYLDRAMFAITHVIGTVHKDLIMKVTRYPMPYYYGPKGSGKSALGDSVLHVFFSGKDSQGFLYKPFNLNQGTEFAFFNKLERFINCPVILNEFDEDAIHDKYFRAIKGAYDGEGREKGFGDKNKTITQKINTAPVIIGQYLGNKDDNSVVTRTIPTQFYLNETRTDEQVAVFRELEKLQDKGINSIICEIMNLRPRFSRDFDEAFSVSRKALGDEMKKLNVKPQDRILKNLSCMLAIYEVATSGGLKLPFTHEQFFNHVCKNCVWLTQHIAQSSGIADFWGMVEYMLDRGLITEGADIILDDVAELTIDTGGESTDIKTFNPERKILFLRLNNVHKAYLQEYRKSHNKVGFNSATLLTYLKDDESYIGKIKSKGFRQNGKRIVTSCYAFDYDLLGTNLERVADDTGSGDQISISGIVCTELSVLGDSRMASFMVEVALPLNNPDGTTITNTERYKCFVPEISSHGGIYQGNKIQLIGRKNVINQNNRTFINIDVDDYECVNNYSDFTRKLGEDSHASSNGVANTIF